MTTTRRGLLGMLAAGVGAAIIRTPGLLMPVKVGLVTALPYGMAANIPTILPAWFVEYQRLILATQIPG